MINKSKYMINSSISILLLPGGGVPRRGEVVGRKNSLEL